MSSRSKLNGLFLVLLGLSLVAFAGCGKGHEGDHSHGEDADHSHGDDPAEKLGEVVEAGGGKALEVVLAKADAVDGTEDKIVSKCAGCALQMDGTDEHKLEAAGYELHFCSEGCKGHFEEGTEKALMALQIPE